MTAAPAPEQPGTAVARQRSVGALPPAIQQAIELRKAQNAVASEIASLNWGKLLDHKTRAAVADWGQRFAVDVTTEIDVLGQNIYLNARFYLRRLGQMVSAGLVEYAVADHIEVDPRLDQIGPGGEGEKMRRLMERIKHQVPDKAVSAVAFRVKLRSMEKEVVGVKWTGGREKDPVGNAFPVETAESRAARRAMRQIASHVPEVAAEVEALELSAESVSEAIGDGKARVAEHEARTLPAPRAPIPPALPMDPYALGVETHRTGAAQPALPLNEFQDDSDLPE